ncbi:hypothetical protein B0H16DRAFT_1544285 [Mycena metata]|uniref:BTB domain-containing protein n=1 Tax=Mycena metata TaxID=1033252 RepID=A0AAD7IZA9_9AGAR|nr:hypothetical protein B0H16DRAFT_1544285 [Mycena metata]
MTTTNSHAASVAQPLPPTPALVLQDSSSRTAAFLSERRTVFRVYRDMLATHSSGFAGMLAGASPELMDECPFVHLLDSAKDIECFLKAIFDFRFFRPYPAPTTSPILSGVLQMSHKYDAEDLLKRALFQSSSAFPTSLVEWETRNYNVSWSRDGYTLPIIVVARQVAADWVIPAALYRLCQTLKEEEILDGVVVSGSTVKLDRRDQILVMKASTFLRCDATFLALEFLKPPSGPDACPKSSCIILRMQARAYAEGWRRTDHGGSLDSFLESNTSSLIFCVSYLVSG